MEEQRQMLSSTLKRLVVSVMMALFLVSSLAVSAVSAGGGMPSDFCATGPRSNNPAWQIVDHPSWITNPGCGSNTRYVMSLNGSNHTDSWADLETMRNGQNATYYNEWVGSNPPPSSPNPPSGWCNATFWNSPAWVIPSGTPTMSKPCSGKGAFIMQLNGKTYGHLSPKSWAKLESIRNGRAATYYRDALQPKPAGFCNGTAGWHMPTGVRVDGNLCGSGWIVKYKLTVKVPGKPEHIYKGSLDYVFNQRKLCDRNYEATLWVVSKRPKPKPPCGC